MRFNQDVILAAWLHYESSEGAEIPTCSLAVLMSEVSTGDETAGPHTQATSSLLFPKELVLPQQPDAIL